MAFNKEEQAEHYKKHAERIKRMRRLSAHRSLPKLKREVLSHYGKHSKLLCCWKGCVIADSDMLTIDHMNNDGAKHRKTYRGTLGGVILYARLKRSGYPRGFQTLCNNHQIKKELVRRRKGRNVS